MNAIDTPEKGEPIDTNSRPENMLEAEAGYVRQGDMGFNGLWPGPPIPEQSGPTVSFWV